MLCLIEMKTSFNRDAWDWRGGGRRSYITEREIENLGLHLSAHLCHQLFLASLPFLFMHLINHIHPINRSSDNVK